MTASEELMTDGQVDNLVDKFRAAVRKHCSEFPRSAVQEALGVENLGMECLTPFRRRVEAISNLIVCRVKVNRNLSPQEVLNATGHRQYTDQKVVDGMPRGNGEETEVVFFNLGRYVNDDDLEKEYEIRGLKPADPYSLAAVNEADPTFTDQNHNSTHWKDANGKWCYAAFFRWRGIERYVRVFRFDCAWSGCWWFAGLRK